MFARKRNATETMRLVAQPNKKKVKESFLERGAINSGLQTKKS